MKKDSHAARSNCDPRGTFLSHVLVLSQSPFDAVSIPDTACQDDSIFQRKWPRQNKIRPPFDVLHIGTAGSNWYGRASPYLDGNVHKKSAERTEMVMEIWNKRRAAYKEGLDGEDIWRREKL